MANVYAVKSGNWSDTTVWNTGALPTSADVVFSGGFTVTIDTTATVALIKNVAATGITAGGTFKYSNGGNLTCTSQLNPSADDGSFPASLVTFDASLGVTGTLAASIRGSRSTGTNAMVVVTGAGTFNIVGSLTDNPVNSGCAVRITSSSGTVNITGNVTAAANQSGVLAFAGTGAVNVTGDVAGGAAAGHAIVVSSTGSITVTGNVTGGANGTANGIITSTTSSINVIGTATGGSSANAVVHSGAGGSLSHTGQAVAANNVPAIYVGSASPTVIFSGPFICSANGTHAVVSFVWKWANISPPATYYQIRSANLSVIRPLYTADSVGGNPAVSNVRSGTVYGPSSELTGTCAVPSAASVITGVPVDNTVGTAAISAQSIRDAIGLSSGNLDSQLLSISKKVGLSILNIFK